jgi:hypothetical protein
MQTVRATLARRNARLRPASAALLEQLFKDSQDKRSRFIAQRNA